MKKLLLILILAIGVLLVGYIFIKSNQRMTVDESHPEIATDPNFKQSKGEIIEGAPDFPAYPGATLVGSAKVSPEGEENRGYRIVWDSHDSVMDIMAFYEKNLPKKGWKYEAPNDRKAVSEQVARISNDEYNGYIGAEIEGDVVEIVLDVRFDN